MTVLSSSQRFSCLCVCSLSPHQAANLLRLHHGQRFGRGDEFTPEDHLSVKHFAEEGQRMLCVSLSYLSRTLRLVYAYAAAQLHQVACPKRFLHGHGELIPERLNFVKGVISGYCCQTARRRWRSWLARWCSTPPLLRMSTVVFCPCHQDRGGGPCPQGQGRRRMAPN